MPTFTDRQLQVARLVELGQSNEEAGQTLGIAPRTAKAHTDVLRVKLGLSRRRQIPAALRALGVPLERYHAGA